ncbi:MAG: Glu-tRNA(Gln) amidotransferase subunit GatD [Candidatus Nanoarchaeia archaeon]|nr:Glu-tRNA(Gln) amidotransferase subunit GatD [Candidatus Nanoarchaeia archaeon]
MKKPFKKPEAGDKIEVILNNRTEKGIFLESHDAGILLLKLENGYNIGLKKEDIKEIKIIESKKSDNKNETEEKFELSHKKPLIDFIITGGTISSKLDPSTGGVKDLTNPKEFFSVYPEIFNIADVRIQSPFMKWSENMDSNDWIRIAKIVEKSLNDENVKGVIISHGTDTLHYTSSALSFMLGKLNKPVVLTYSQRSSDRGSADSRMNLICSAYAALSEIAEVILVGHANMNDEYCYALRGTKVRKMHTSRRDTFRPINCKPVAKIFPNGKIEFISEYNKKSPSFFKVKSDAVFDEKTALIKFYPGQSPDILDYYLKNKYKGLIIEFVGIGQVANQGKNNWIPKLKEAIESGMLIYAAPQTLYGRLDPYVYESARRILETGVVYLEDILPETALVKLGWVLGHKEWRGSVATKMKMLENFAGEFNKKLGKEFLD